MHVHFVLYDTNTETLLRKIALKALTQDLGWLRVSVSAHPFSADRAVFAEMKGSRPLVDIPSHEVLGAINPNEEVAGPHSPSISGARRHVWGSPTVARSFISAAAMPFFHVRQSRRLFAAAYHFDIASFGRSFSSHRIFSFILFRSFASFSRSFFHRIVISFLSLCFAYSSLYFSHACSSEGYSSLPDFQRAFRFLAWFPCFLI